MKYRLKVVKTNLRNAYPDKSEAELDSWLPAIYKNLSDVLIEILKGVSCSAEEIRSRYSINNLDLIEECINSGKSCLLICQHYTNWDWGTYFMPLANDLNYCCVYQKITNPHIEKYFKKRRERFGITMVTNKELMRAVISRRKQPTVYILVADQAPNRLEKPHFLKFMNQLTACPNGMDKLARKFDMPVYWVDNERVDRGKYILNLRTFTEKPKELQEEELTKIFMTALEKKINLHPQNWLWTHRRWKQRHYDRAKELGIEL